MRCIDADALKEYIHNQDGRPFIGITIGEAFQMMVDEQPTIEERKTGDLISRQAAIDAFANEKNNENTPTADRLWIRLGLERTCEILRELPSAQPDVIRCRDCKHFGGGTYCYERDDMWDENDFCSYAERKEQDDG